MWSRTSKPAGLVRALGAGETWFQNADTRSRSTPRRLNSAMSLSSSAGEAFSSSWSSMIDVSIRAPADACAGTSRTAARASEQGDERA